MTDKQSWEDEFDEKFGDETPHWEYEVVCTHDDYCACPHRLDPIKSFIKSIETRAEERGMLKQILPNTLDKLRQEERDRFIKLIDGMKKELQTELTIDPNTIAIAHGWNEALKTIKKQI